MNLTPEQRELIIESRLSGNTPATISRELGLPYAKVANFITLETNKGRFDCYSPVPFSTLQARPVSVPARYIRHNPLMTLCPI